eukprot:TRINITY_DN50008_c0_g1_i1.p1 TRINITY_DN50008_c0_g1~~TRINITY_DN50008_c0_g1_i1.p1  ORF type:complete len:1206 (+),score=162.29 TRINITY_DN50008_c0_g1_i1:80-3697(+)
MQFGAVENTHCRDETRARTQAVDGERIEVIRGGESFEVVDGRQTSVANTMFSALDFGDAQQTVPRPVSSPFITPKSELVELMHQRLKRSLAKGEIAYNMSSGPPYTATVNFSGVASDGLSCLSFAGEPHPRKRDAEHSAACRAISALQSVPPPPPRKQGIDSVDVASPENFCHQVTPSAKMHSVGGLAPVVSPLGVALAAFRIDDVERNNPLVKGDAACASVGDIAGTTKTNLADLSDVRLDRSCISVGTGSVDLGISGATVSDATKINTKGELNNLMHRLLRRPLKKNDVVYATNSMPPFTSTVKLVALYSINQHEIPLEFIGESRGRKTEAEHSAARSALDALGQSSLSSLNSYIDVTASSDQPSCIPQEALVALTKSSPSRDMSKSRLNELVQQRLGRPLTRGDIVYEAVSVSPFVMMLKFSADVGRKLEVEAASQYSGGPFYKKVDAEHSAARVAIEALLQPREGVEVQNVCGFADHRGTNTSADASTERSVEHRCRLLPSKLTMPPPDHDELHGLERRLYLHILKVVDRDCVETKTFSRVGVLLPLSCDLRFDAFLPGEEVRCELCADASSCVSLSLEELRDVAAWSFGALSLFATPLASLCERLDPSVRPLVLDTNSGDFSLGKSLISRLFDGSDQCSRTEQPCFVALPIVGSETLPVVDWPLIRAAIPYFRSATFPRLADGLDSSGDFWTDAASGARFSRDDFIISSRIPRPRRSIRTQFLTHIAFLSGIAENSSDISHLVGGRLLHRSFIHAGASAEPVPQLGGDDVAARGGVSLAVDDCHFIPLPNSIVRALLAIPVTLWSLELRLGVEELQAELVALRRPLRVPRGLVRLALTRSGVETHFVDDTEEGAVVSLDLCGEDGERLEFLGDSVLKVLSCARAFLELPSAGEAELARVSSAALTNHVLREAAERLRITDRLVARRFARKIGHLGELREQEIPWKAPADVFEALVGAAWLAGGGCVWPTAPSSTLPTSEPIGVTEDFRASLDDFFRRYVLTEKAAAVSDCPALSDMFASVTPPRGPTRTSSPGGMACWLGTALAFERAEFLGDAVLDVLVTEHLFKLMPAQVRHGGLSTLRSWLVSNNYLARRAARMLRSGPSSDLCQLFYSFLARHGCGPSVTNFLQPSDRLSQIADLHAAASSSGQIPPKCLADVYEAMVGAVYLQNRGSLTEVWAGICDDFDFSQESLMDILHLYAS